MKRQNRKILNTTFGTYLAEVNPEIGLFFLTRDTTVPIDTPLENQKGTTKMFLTGSVVSGNLWKEMDDKVKKTRQVVMVQDENGRYLIPKQSLEPTTKPEVEVKAAKKEIENLDGKIKELVEKINVSEPIKKIESPVASATDSVKGFLDKEYIGFTGKQIVMAALGVIILIKLFK